MLRHLALAVALFVLGFGVSQAQQVTWDYAVLSYDGNTWSFQSPDGSVPSLGLSLFTRELRKVYPQPPIDGMTHLLEALNILGGEGWELVTESNSIFYFKRQGLSE